METNNTTNTIVVMKAKPTRKSKLKQLGNRIKQLWLAYKFKYGKLSFNVLIALSGLLNVYSFWWSGDSVLQPVALVELKDDFKHLDKKKQDVMTVKASLRTEDMKPAKKTVDDYVIQDRHKNKLSKAVVYLANEMFIKHGVPVEITLAQYAIETTWGTTGMAKKAHNYFGHKQYTKSGDGIVSEAYMAQDDCGGKDCKFQWYENRWWGFHYHCSRILKRYMKKRKGNNLNDYVECLCAKKNKLGKGSMNYASSCEDRNDPYDEKIKRFIRDENLSFYYQP